MSELQKKASLDEVMSAMDVVDVLRHQQDLVTRELDSEGREQQLLERLRKIYKGQGMEVPDHILKEGIKALEDERFKYSPHENSKLASLYVTRGSWGKPLSALIFIAGFAFTAYYLTQIRPAQQERKAIPLEIAKTFNQIQSVSKDPALTAKLFQTRESAETAYDNKNYAAAKKFQQELNDALTILQQDFKIRIISRPNESSGIWRSSEVNSTNRNYYLIVEAISKQNKTIPLPILNEENNQRVTVKKWGLRVDRETFNRVANDKRDDGIIQNNIVGEKQRGTLNPYYKIKTNGKAITQW